MKTKLDYLISEILWNQLWVVVLQNNVHCTIWITLSSVKLFMWLVTSEHLFLFERTFLLQNQLLMFLVNCSVRLYQTYWCLVSHQRWLMLCINCSIKVCKVIVSIYLWLTIGVEIQCIGHFKLLFSLLRVEGCPKVQQHALEASHSFFCEFAHLNCYMSLSFVYRSFWLGYFDAFDILPKSSWVKSTTVLMCCSGEWV